MASDYIDDVLVTLSDPRRRHVLCYLRHHDAADIEELADALTGWLTVENDIVVTPKRRHESDWSSLTPISRRSPTPISSRTTSRTARSRSNRFPTTSARC